MNTKSMVVKTSSLLKLVEQRIQSKRELEQNRKKQRCENEPQDSFAVVPEIPDECIFDIIVRLPIESLQTLRFVCKSWYGIVNSPVFINAHFQRSDIGLIFFTPVEKALLSSDAKINFFVESKVSEVHHWTLFDAPSLFQIKCMEIKDGKSIIKDYNTTCTGEIIAACNGLIVLKNRMKRGGLIIMNPVTRELKPLPLGTIFPTRSESYGLAFCHESSGYKLVHLFEDDLEYTCWEIMDIGSGSWRVVNGPPNGYFGYRPIFAIGALHWLRDLHWPQVDHNEYMVSMTLDDEQFMKIQLPSIGRISDRIFEMDRFLGFVSREDTNRIDVWMLRSLSGESWEKKFSISVDGFRNMVPLYCGRVHGELVFKCTDNDIYTFDHHSRLLRKIEVSKEFYTNFSLPHVNSLISWRR
ncbi:hypothetical protein DH2020_049558 [Rehmannia glutinosa]|uniref:F-box domain-containing protein n=1 Tax=Rehmannia glutinosa TaxID=99300 RepID=A0ABR0U2F0_REHGL